MSLTEQEHWWSSAEGLAYIARNKVDWRTRFGFWVDILNRTRPASVLEVGCNVGNNMLAIRSLNRQISLVGIDVNEAAIDEATMHGLTAELMSVNDVGPNWPEAFDLTFTAGVLIHIHPDHLSQAMDSIILASKRFVLAIEYESEHEVMISYRGSNDLLWKRPYGKLYQAKGLALLETGDAGPGFDRCVWHLLEKPT